MYLCCMYIYALSGLSLSQQASCCPLQTGAAAGKRHTGHVRLSAHSIWQVTSQVRSYADTSSSIQPAARATAVSCQQEVPSAAPSCPSPVSSLEITCIEHVQRKVACCLAHCTRMQSGKKCRREGTGKCENKQAFIWVLTHSYLTLISLRTSTESAFPNVTNPNWPVATIRVSHSLLRGFIVFPANFSNDLYFIRQRQWKRKVCEPNEGGIWRWINMKCIWSSNSFSTFW